MSSTKTIGKKCREKFPDKIPIIVSYQGFYVRKPSNLVISEDSTFEFLSNSIRKHANIPYNEIFNLLVNGNKLENHNILADIYLKNKDPNDDCLHVMVIKE